VKGLFGDLHNWGWFKINRVTPLYFRNIYTGELQQPAIAKAPPYAGEVV